MLNLCSLYNFKIRFYNFEMPIYDIRDIFETLARTFIVILQQINQPNNMKRSLYILSGLIPILSACSASHVIEVTNPTPLDRHEIVEISRADLLKIRDDDSFSLYDNNGKEIPYQITHDDKIVFPVSVKGNGKTQVTVNDDKPSPSDTVCCGAFYPERKDDLAWENDHAAYRAYGPALQASGEQAYGYDIWTKSIVRPVVRQRYEDAFTKDVNFHEDHGNGMDVYSVGPTLGGGTAALVDSTGNIVYPECFSSHEILDNGPLRFCVRLKYDSGETRLITLDAGEYLNKTCVSYSHPYCSTVAPGIVIHSQNPEGYELAPENSYMAYADLTDNADNGNGVIFVGVVTPQVDSMLNVPLDEPRGDAIGHILAKRAYKHGDRFTYYWGSGWSKGDMPDWQTWKQYLADFSIRISYPLNVSIK